jgi:hypothetical protein
MLTLFLVGTLGTMAESPNPHQWKIETSPRQWKVETSPRSGRSKRVRAADDRK